MLPGNTSKVSAKRSATVLGSATIRTADNKTGDSTESSDKRANLLAKRTGPPAPTDREVAEGVVFGPADSAEERSANEA
ncbi:hypothetical protein E2C01_042666 [Portunus trituberculatus]|uniref:Uncharacterized protein n=1 Tax=Portunus trituberculatus TaxID=210409 RepID=A0A5B7FU81_PORTR|nr:hypothetical protein [Portunus trituberculatus]